MIFSKEHLYLVLRGRKTQTRRLGRRRWNEGAVHPVKSGRYDKPAGWVRILHVRCAKLGAITLEDAEREGYSSIQTYKQAWERVYKAPWAADLETWVIDFRIHNGPEWHQQTTIFEEVPSNG